MSTPPRVIEPLAAPPDATVRVPGSKSITNRALVCAALAEGDSVLEGALRADDTEAMVGCLRALGIEIAGFVSDGPVQVQGCRGSLPATAATLDVRLSGTTSRFIAPVAATGHGHFEIDGLEPMRRRPMAPLIDALRALRVEIDELGEPGHLPFLLRSVGVHGGRVELSGDVSSQFLSGVLLAAPSFTEGVDVALTSELVSEPYVALTRAVMTAFGVEPDGLRVPPATYHSRTFSIEPDASTASYFFAAAAITGGRVRVDGLGVDSPQGDLAFVDILEAMGASVECEQDATTVMSESALHGVTVDMRHLSDTVPTLAVVAVFADSPTTITGVGFIRGKESDRIDAVVTELRRCGVDAEAHDDGLTVHPGEPRPAVVQTYDDHRIAMAFSVLGLRASGIAIADPSCVAKTFPGYFDALERLRHRSV